MACVKCDPLKSTLSPGASLPQECKCQAGLYEEAGQCSPCRVGRFCDGSGVAVACPVNSTTMSGGSRSKQDCICEAGYQATGESCEPCPRAFYKSSLGNGQCSFKCPANADSKLGSSSIADCFCTADHHAILDDDGNLARCAACSLYRGLECPGGFDEQGSHVQPRAVERFFRTGTTSAVECMVLQPDGSSACRGGTLASSKPRNCC